MVRLIIERASQLTAERGGGTIGGIAARLADRSFLVDMREASEYVKLAIAAVRSAPGGDVYTSDEEVAEKILAAIEERRAG